MRILLPCLILKTLCLAAHTWRVYKPNKGVPPTSKRAPLFSLELVLEQKHYHPITDIIRITPFFSAEIHVWTI